MSIATSRNSVEIIRIEVMKVTEQRCLKKEGIRNGVCAVRVCVCVCVCSDE